MEMSVTQTPTAVAIQQKAQLCVTDHALQVHRAKGKFGIKYANQQQIHAATQPQALQTVQDYAKQ